MIKASTTSGVAILGLTEENVKRLREGKPILLDLAEIGFPQQKVVIMYGETAEDIAAELSQLVPGEEG